MAEELIYQEVSTGARDDLMKATDIAKSMVKAYGMSDALGQTSFDQEREPMFLPMGQPHGSGEYSEKTAQQIDAEVGRIIEQQYTRVTDLLGARRVLFQEAAAFLIRKETMSGDEL